jgi:TRAP transporter TAXI family solute receptor
MAERASTWHGQLRTWLERLGVFGPAILLTIAGFAVCYHFVQPAPPRRLVIAAGPTDGAYYYYGRIYRDLLAKEGIVADLVATPGSIANIERLNQDRADVAFVQGGTRTDGGDTPLRSLASLYYEPIWLFVRRDAPVERLADLRGQRVAVDVEGSGTRAIALQLLADTGLDESAVQSFPLGGKDAAAALGGGRIDAAFFVIGAGSPVVHGLLAARDIRLVGIDRAAAYTLRHPYLTRLVLPEGAIDLATNEPPADMVLLAPAANLVVRKDFHPALAELLLSEAQQIHSYAGLFEAAGEFPSRQHLEFPIAPEAQRYFERGPSLLQRYLPFWAANLIDRLIILLLPVVTLVYPLIKIVPPIYNWRMRSRINRWYKELQAIERRVEPGASPDDLRHGLDEVERIAHKVQRLSMPASYGSPLYTLRNHIAMLRDDLRNAVAPEAP